MEQLRWYNVMVLRYFQVKVHFHFRFSNKEILFMWKAEEWKKKKKPQEHCGTLLDYLATHVFELQYSSNFLEIIDLVLKYLIIMKFS